MNRAKLVFRRLRKIRSDRVLRWVFPGLSNYTVTTWRRVNPRYDMSGGDFTGINCWNLTGVSFCRTHTGAILIQLLMGREKWTDGFSQQIVRISKPGSQYLIPPRDVSFLDYPTHDKPDLIPNVDGLGSGVDPYVDDPGERLPGCLDDKRFGHKLPELPTNWPKFADK